jgi:ATP-dependent DNA ligase
MVDRNLTGPVWLMQPIPYFGESLNSNWNYEPKFDGWRLQLIKYRNGRVECWGRRLEKNPNWTDKLPMIIEHAEKHLPAGILLDCELTTEKGRRFIPSVFAKKSKVEPVLYVFDLVFFNNQFIGDAPLAQRKKIIEILNLPAPFKLTPYQPVKNLKIHLKKLLAGGQEGMVIKDFSSPYIICKDGPMATEHWRKIKSVLRKSNGPNDSE